MADEAPAAESGAPPQASDHEFSSHMEQPQHFHNTSRKSTWSKSAADVQVTGTQTPMSGMNHHRHTSLGPHLEEYFVCSLVRMTKVTRSTNYIQVGPRDMDAHSKLPYFLRVHGSVTPRMILPLTMVGAWATLITCICEFITPREQLLCHVLPF
jgi:ion channel-forming bestrophin family protein